MASCVLLFLVALVWAVNGSTIYVTDFVPYPGYTGDLVVSGIVSIAAHGHDSQTVMWHLSGVDTACTQGAGTTIPNACGIHFHTGTTLTSDFGGHYYGNVSSDPWADFDYVADSNGNSAGYGIVTTGLTLSDCVGRAFVVHQLGSGARAAVGIAKAAPTAFVTHFSRTTTVSGTMTLAKMSDTEQALTWDLKGLDTLCTSGAANDVTDGCGIRVHSGTSCETDDNMGDHWHSTVSPDPWSDVVYVANSMGASKGTTKVATGLTLADMFDRSVTVHKLADGAPIACGIFEAAPAAYATSFAPYPGCTDCSMVHGTVTIAAVSSTVQTMMWNLHGLDPLCIPGAADSVTNGCAVHVHTGTSCADAATVGGHYYGNSLPADPWLPITYVSDSSGYSHGYVTVHSGLTLAEMVGRAFIVHKLENGARIACAIVEAAPSVSVNSFSMYPSYTGNMHVSGALMLAKTTDTTQTLAWNLGGLDSSCVQGAAHGMTNGCGLTAHIGTSCVETDQVGGSYYSSSLTSDPWEDVSYVADSSAKSQGTMTVASGLTLSELIGHAFIVREHSGASVACGIIGMDEPSYPSHTCGEIKHAYKHSGCCGSPSKMFQFPFSRRLSGK